MSQSFDASRSLTALEQDNTIVAVIEMSKTKWLVAALVDTGRSALIALTTAVPDKPNIVSEHNFVSG